MNIVIIGTGNVATVLGRALKQAGHIILQIVGRSSTAASELAYRLDTVSTNYWIQIDRSADLYIIAVSDNSIAEVASQLTIPDKMIVHTAASVSMDVLKVAAKCYGVFYPLQSMSKEMNRIPEIPIFFDGSDDKIKELLEKLARSIAGEKIALVKHSDIVNLHVAAVFANNFTNYLYLLAEEYCKVAKIDFRLLYPLIEEAALRLKYIAPKEAQTGPAIRHDTITIQKHLHLLEPYPELYSVYKMISESIVKTKFIL